MRVIFVGGANLVTFEGGYCSPRIVNDVPYNVCPTSYCRFSWLW